MKVLSFQHVEDCIDGSSRFHCSLDRELTRDDILRLRALGDLDYFPDFPRPYFRVRTTDGSQIRGVEGNSHCSAVLAAREGEVMQERLLRVLADDDDNTRPALEAGLKEDIYG